MNDDLLKALINEHFAARKLLEYLRDHYQIELGKSNDYLTWSHCVFLVDMEGACLGADDKVEGQITKSWMNQMSEKCSGAAEAAKKFRGSIQKYKKRRQKMWKK